MLKILNYFLLLNYIFAQNYSLDDCVNIALKNKKTILSASLEISSAKKGLIGSYSSLLPSLNFNTNSSRTNFPEQISISRIDLNLETISFDTVYRKTSYYESFSSGLSLNQTIYNGGRNFNQIEQARLSLDIASLNKRSTEIEVIQNVINAYYNLLKAQKLYDVATKNLEMSQQQVDLVEQQFNLGVVRKTDFLKAKVAEGQAKVDLLNNKTSLANSRRVLFNDMGLQDFGQSIIASDKNWTPPIIPSSSELLKQLKEKNPNTLLYKKQTQIKKNNYELIKGLRKPSIVSSFNYSANAQYFNQMADAFKDDWSLGMNLSLSIPIYTGNSLSMQQQQAKISINQAEYVYINLINDFKVQIELIRESIENYSEIIPLNEAVVSSAEEDLKLVRERYSLGSSTILEVLDAQISLFRSNTTLINTIHNARIQEANLKALIGSLDSEYQNKED